MEVLVLRCSGYNVEHRGAQRVGSAAKNLAEVGCRLGDVVGLGVAVLRGSRGKALRH